MLIRLMNPCITIQGSRITLRSRFRCPLLETFSPKDMYGIFVGGLVVCVLSWIALACVAAARHGLSYVLWINIHSPQDLFLFCLSWFPAVSSILVGVCIGFPLLVSAIWRKNWREALLLGVGICLALAPPVVLTAGAIFIVTNLKGFP